MIWPLIRLSQRSTSNLKMCRQPRSRRTRTKTAVKQILCRWVGTTPSIFQTTTSSNLSTALTTMKSQLFPRTHHLTTSWWCLRLRPKSRSKIAPTGTTNVTETYSGKPANDTTDKALSSKGRRKPPTRRRALSTLIATRLLTRMTKRNKGSLSSYRTVRSQCCQVPPR